MATRKRLVTPEDICTALARTYALWHRRWFGGEATDAEEARWPIVRSLGAPTERDVIDDAAAVRAWVNAWARWPGPGTVREEERQWPRMGTQRIPASIAFGDAAAIAALVGDGSRWRRATERRDELIARWPALAGAPELARHYDVFADYGDADITRLCAFLEWVVANPSSGLYLRQVPVAGLDTKWVERRRGVVTDLSRVLTGRATGGDFHDVCGLRRARVRMRVRILCLRLRQSVGGLADAEAPVEQLAALPIAPANVLIVENLESGLALPDLDGTVAIMGLGSAVGLIGELPWVRGARCYYWGDIDTHGFAILDAARRAVPGIASLLMDEATLLAHRPLWVEEASPFAADAAALTAQERDVLAGLQSHRWGVRVRLEQERVDWQRVLHALENASTVRRA